MKVRRGLLIVACVMIPAEVSAQGYRVRLDVRGQAISFGTLIADSVPVGQTAVSSNGGPVSLDGFAVSCRGAWCYFFRPGQPRRSAPVSATASLVAWGVGRPGVSVHVTARQIGQVGEDGAWPGAEPASQLLDGYAELDRGALVARAGRVVIFSRLEPIGLDGAWTRYRWRERDLEATVYGGWGLGQAAAVPVASPALNPLDEWRPRDRQLVAGAELAWFTGPVELRTEYRREVDPETDYFVSERMAASGAVRISQRVRVAGGADYNLAEGHLGSADLAMTWADRQMSLSVGGRRYRPYFSLWTLWGAFSPIPYHAVHASGRVTLKPWLTVRSRGELFRYGTSDAATPLVTVENGGWRASTGLTLTPDPRWNLDIGWRAEFGPGASQRAVDARLGYTPKEEVTLSVYGGTLDRPLELRFYDARANWIGGRMDWRTGGPWRMWADGAWFAEQRNRPDAANSALDQFRVRTGVSVNFGTDADRSILPPARRGL